MFAGAERQLDELVVGGPDGPAKSLVDEDQLDVGEPGARAADVESPAAVDSVARRATRACRRTKSTLDAPLESPSHSLSAISASLNDRNAKKIESPSSVASTPLGDSGFCGLSTRSPDLALSVAA